jgi:predicted dehydrogenase
MYSGAHARRLRARTEVRIAALCSRTEASARTLIERRLADYSPTPSLYTSTSEMYGRESLDAVVIVTPHDLHYRQAVEALEAGCHVLVEKPMTTTADDARSLVRMSEEKGRVVGVCYDPLYTAALACVREAVRSGRLGRLEMVTGYLCQDWKRLTMGSWRHDPARAGGGQAMDSGAHLLASLCWSVGSPPREVFALLDRQDEGVDVNSATVIRFENRVLATIAVGGNSPGDGSHMSFVFDGGRIDVDGWRGRWVRVYRGTEEEPQRPESLPSSPDDNFVGAILDGAEPICTARDGLAVAELLDALYRSAASGEPIRTGQREGEER